MSRIIEAVFVCAGMAVASHASAVAITGYDIDNAKASGFGGWSYAYTGTITPDGDKVDLAGGGGTLNDGLAPPSSTNNNQLFQTSAGASITLHLAESAFVSSIVLLGGVSGNMIPGTLTGWSVTIGGQTVALNSAALGGNCGSGPCDDRVSLAGTGLDLLSTTTVTLNAFQGGWNDYFSIAEVQVEGAAGLPPQAATQVPEPGSLALLGAGVVGLVARRRSRG